MILLILVIFTILSIVFGILHLKFRKNKFRYKDYDCGWLVACAVLGAFACLMVLACCIMWCDVSTECVIDQKIEMYQEENDKIEAEIAIIVSQYMEYEKDTLIGVSPNEDVMVLVSLFPELKSDELVKQQISIHTSNASKIKSLKENKIDIGIEKWLLYFGR